MLMFLDNVEKTLLGPKHGWSDKLEDFPVQKMSYLSTTQRETLDKAGIKTLGDLADMWGSLTDLTSESLPLEVLEKASAGARILIIGRRGEAEQTIEPLKIMLVGLDAAGKSSILNMLTRTKPLWEIRQIISQLMPTLGSSHERLSIAGLPINVLELGGHEKYRNDYLKQPEEYFLRSHALIFVIDATNKERYDLALNYLQKTIDLMAFLSLKHPIYVFLHKNDPNVADENHQIIRGLKKKLRDVLPPSQRENIFETSVFRPSSISEAFTRIIQQLLPIVHWLNEDLARASIEELGTPYLSIIDQKLVLLGEYSAFSNVGTETVRNKFFSMFYGLNLNLTEPVFVVLEDNKIDAKQPLYLTLSNVSIGGMAFYCALVGTNKNQAVKYNRKQLSELLERRVGPEVRFLTVTQSTRSHDKLRS